MIYTSYFGKLRSLPDNIIPISITMGAPPWFNGVNYNKLSPKYDFFSEWKRDGDDERFSKCFREQVLDKLSPLRIVSELQLMIPNEIKEKMQSPIYINEEVNIALICYEKSSDFCHRHLVADWLTENGFKCEEWSDK